MSELQNVEFKELLVGLTRVETKLDTLGNVKDTHVRIDRLDKLVFWIGTTTVGAMITGGIMVLFNFVGK